jgi:phosphoadenosine phosphosulfate reductase
MTTAVDTDLHEGSPSEWAEAAARLDGAPARDIVRWAGERFGSGLIATVSFEDAVLAHLVATNAPGTEVAFLDTQYHFAETLWYVEELRRRYDLNLRVLEPLVEPDNRWRTDVEGCCGVRKVEPLARALAGRAAWITGLRRADAPTRANAPIVSWDLARSMVKVNPLASWTDADMAGYVADHELPGNPLSERGYPSIGCWPCTRPVMPGEDPRSGRWSGKDKTECGLHA